MENKLEKISVIIPVYNVKKYIEKCLLSVMRQTYNNLEILIIDDGSTDNGIAICEKYKKIDNRIKIFYKKNGGVSSARNVGIKNANGQYILFIDSDDYLELDMLEQLYKNLIRDNADISMCEYWIEEEGEKPKRKFENDKKLVLEKNDFYKKILEENYFGGYLFNKLIKRELINNNGNVIFFNEKIHICEDLLFMCEIAKNMKKAVYITKPCYYYVQRKNSAIKQLYTYKRLTNYYAYKRIFDIYKEENIEIDKRFELKFLKFSSEVLFLMRYLKINDKVLKKDILKNRKFFYYKYINDQEIDKKEKMKIYMDYHFTYIVGWLRFVKNKE